MALVKRFRDKPMERNSIHAEIEASVTSFEYDGRRFLQIDTYGSDERQIPGKKSQSIQLDQEGAAALFGILKEHFNLT